MDDCGTHHGDTFAHLLHTLSDDERHYLIQKINEGKNVDLKIDLKKNGISVEIPDSVVKFL